MEVHMGSKVMGRLQDPLDTLPIGTIMWFEQAITSVKWQIYTPLVGRYPLGVDDAQVAGDTVSAGLPNITGSTKTITMSMVHGSETNVGALKSTVLGAGAGSDSNSHSGIVEFDASWSDSIYGNSNTVTPASVKLLPYIKIA